MSKSKDLELDQAELEDLEPWPGRYEVTVMGRTKDGISVGIALFEDGITDSKRAALLESAGYPDYAKFVRDGNYKESPKEYWFMESLVDQTFDAREVLELVEWFVDSPDATVEIRQACKPAPGWSGASCRQIGGTADIIRFSQDEDYTPSVKVAGFYDLRDSWRRDKEQGADSNATPF